MTRTLMCVSVLRGRVISLLPSPATVWPGTRQVLLPVPATTLNKRVMPSSLRTSILQEVQRVSRGRAGANDLEGYCKECHNSIRSATNAPLSRVVPHGQTLGKEATHLPHVASSPHACIDCMHACMHPPLVVCPT